MARRTKEQRIAELQASHARDVLHATARSGLDIIKAKMHTRDYEAARLEAGRVFVELARLCGAVVPDDYVLAIEGTKSTEQLQREFAKITNLPVNEKGASNAGR